jgi:hypothetical protein
MMTKNNAAVAIRKSHIEAESAVTNRKSKP